MVIILIIIAALALIIQAFIGLTYFISCILEKEKGATVLAGLQFSGMLGLVSIFFFLVWVDFFETRVGFTLLICGLVFGALASFLLIRRSGANPKAMEGTRGLIIGEVKRPDERETVFARNMLLQPGSEMYEMFYKEHPEIEECDAKRREKGGVFGPMGAIDKPHEGPNVATAMASLFFSLGLAAPDKIKPFSLTGSRIDLNPEEATERIKGYAQSLGADLVGITEVNPLWFYSHRGMTLEDWGKEIELEHKYAIVFAVEMSREMIGAGPHTPSMVESMHKYADVATISAQVASFIANLGYSATANQVHYYEAILVPMAVDAGLGELGRIGYLLTKELGPRVRLGAVTTDLPLIPDKPVDIGVQDFCKICKKCAVGCPASSIALGDHTEVNGSLRWKLNEVTCFDYWGRVGTACSDCMRVCPWSHARTVPHKVILGLVTRNKIARRLFSAMDDIFYGKKPKPKAPPGWARFNPGKTD